MFHHKAGIVIATMLLLIAAAGVATAVCAQTAAELAPPDSLPSEFSRAPGSQDPAPRHPELAGVLEDFGGRAGLKALMDEFMAIMMDDPRMRPFFETVDREEIKRHLTDQFCAILGGDCNYTGRDMVSAHEAFVIDRADFNALVEDLQIAMDRRDIPFRSQNRLVAILAPMHREVIND